MIYTCGMKAKVGDRVDYDDCLSIVSDVIDTPIARRRWGLDEADREWLMLENDEFGLVAEFDTGLVTFLRRGRLRFGWGVPS